MTYLKRDRQKSNGFYLKNANDIGRDCFVPIDRHKHEYIKRLLILYKAQFRQTGECHYPPIVAIVKQKK